MQRTAEHQDLSEDACLPPPDVVVVRYGELSLKGGNRALFERALTRNMKHALEGVSKTRIERHFGRLLVFPEKRAKRVAQRLQDVFGIKSVSPAWSTVSELEAIGKLAEKVFDSAAQMHPTSDGALLRFRVQSRRSDKTFPLQSPALNAEIGARIFVRHKNLKVDLKHPDIEVGIEVRKEGSFVFAERYKGPGGLPVSTLGRALCLLSGGIDSPVAAWLAMKRGCSVSYVSFHSSPYIGESSKKQVLDLARALARYQPKSTLYSVPFTEVQTLVRDFAPEGYRTVLYRRMMQRIAARLANNFRFGALVTGESLGQVASQTMENMHCISSATDMTVLQPLITYDKDEIMDVARKIGTLDISNRGEPDCCTVFQPRKPVIRGKLDDCLWAESQMDWESAVERAVAAVETTRIEHEG